ncbi:MAG: hemerythrin domain-containing protein [Blastochloris sp.]|nr:hemerythrin domain-containing protein [Blastochloris sp.]
MISRDRSQDRQTGTTRPAAAATRMSGAIPPIEALPFGLIDEPLDYLFADHFRGRCICLMLQRFAELHEASRKDADTVIAFLTHDLPLHYADEEIDLFPLLRKRALVEDDLGIPLARLTADHRALEAQAEHIVDVLAASPALDRVLITTVEAENMLAYAASEHAHLAIENGIILAIARIRLTRSDLKALSQSMKLRRGVPN